MKTPLTTLELRARYTEHEIDAAITGLAGNGCDGIIADMIAVYIAASIVYRVETLRADEGHADLIASQCTCFSL